MIAAAVRSRLFELRRDRAAAHRSAELLERKREVLLREVLRRTRRHAELRADLVRATADARRKLAIARVDIGIEGIEAAALAQPPTLTITVTETSVMGVRLPRVSLAETPYRACYGAAATSRSLDEAGAAFAALLVAATRVAEEEKALARLRVAERKVTKLAGALRKIVLPRIEREIRHVVEEIDEEDRDEAVRRQRWRSHAAV